MNATLKHNLFEEFEITGTKKRPTGITGKTKFDNLSVIEDLDYIASISIHSIDHATKIKRKNIPLSKYFCVKMTVVIEIEGLSLKKQSIEERMVLVKATSFEDAYEMLEKQKDDYAEPYLNSDGRLVRWRIDSFDDCYETGITTKDELDNPGGVEVYSRLKSRVNKNNIIWDGKS